MSRRIHTKELVLIVGVTIIGITFLIFLYFQFYKPIVLQSKMTESQLKVEKQLLESTKNHQGNTEEEIGAETNELLTQLPVKPHEDQFLLDIEKAEVISRVKVKEINFSEGVVDFNDESLSTEIPEDNEDDAESEKTPIELPEGMEKLTVSMMVNAHDYFEFEEFLDVLESLPRLLNIETISLKGASEITHLQEIEEMIPFIVEVSIYYMPTLENMNGEDPHIDSPQPAKKKNPFYHLPETTDS